MSTLFVETWVKSKQANVPAGDKSDPNPSCSPQQNSPVKQQNHRKDAFPSKERAARTTGADSALCVTVTILLVQKHAWRPYSGDAWAQNYFSARGPHEGNLRSFEGLSAGPAVAGGCPELDKGCWIREWLGESEEIMSVRKRLE